MKNILLLYQIAFILLNCHASKSQENATAKLDEVNASRKTSRRFKGLELENGLKVILISDPNAVVAAGSLHFAAGSMNDPKSVSGLAHLLEHMLFNGNKKYPEPASFSKYVSENGGDRNALTNQDNTEYKFSVLPTALPGALDRLFHMMNSPLLLDSSVSNEITVVNSEHVKNVPSDDYGLLQIERSTSRQGHPFNNFASGSEETLRTKPHQLGINVTEELKKFHEKYYSSNLMTLVILDERNFTELEEMVTRIFSKLRNSNTTLPSWPEIPYGSTELGIKIEIVPKEVDDSFRLEFPILAKDKDIFDNYYSKLFSRRGNQSLSEFLKSANFVYGLSGDVTERYRGFNVFQISINPTELGVIHLERVVVHVFEFISFLRNNPPKQWFWEEVKDIEDITDRFKTPEDPSQLVSTLGKNLIETSPEETIRTYSKNNIQMQFNSTRVANVLNYITPENMRLYFISNTVKNTTSFEPNYKINYSMMPLDPTFLKSLKMAVPNPSVQFPTRNGYLPKNFTIKPLPINKTDVPTVIESTNISTIWFLQDNYYFVPKAEIRVKLSNPTPYVTPVDSHLNFILQSVINQLLQPIKIYTRVAGTEVRVSDAAFGIEVGVAGYNDGIDQILYKVMETISSIPFTNESFHMAKELQLQLVQFSQDHDGSCRSADTDFLLKETYWSPQELKSALNGISLEDLELFYRKFISRLRMEWLIYGNVLKEEAIQMVQSSEKFFVKRGSHPSSSAEYKWQSKTVQIANGTNWVYKLKTTTPSSTCTRVAFQTPKPDSTDLVKITLLADLMAQPAYVQLRSKDQLGYDVNVHSSSGTGYSSNTLQISVQGEKDPGFVEGRINHFLLMFRDTLRNMTDKEFDERKVVQHQKWEVKSASIESQAWKFWQEIFYGYYNFSRDYNKLQILDGLTLDELQTFYDELIGFGNGNGGQRRLSIHVSKNSSSSGNANNNLNTLTMEFLNQPVVDVIDFVVWRRDQHLYPTTGLK